MTTMPNFLLIGAPKAGTTALYEYLKQHPKIYVSPVKEPNFFAFEGQKPNFRGPKDDQAWTNKSSIVELANYQQLYADVQNEKAIGEASTLYLYLPQTPQRIKHYVPDAKLIAILRHPVERAFSHYLHMRRDGREWLRDFRLAIKSEKQRIHECWSPAWYYQHLGLYSSQIQRYLEVFDRSQIGFFLYDDWRSNPVDFVQSICRFLEIDDDFVPDMSTRHNETKVVWKNVAIRDFFLKKNQLRSTLKLIVPSSIRKPISTMIFKQNMDKPPQLTAELKRELIPLFKEDILRSQHLIDRDLSAWLH